MARCSSKSDELRNINSTVERGTSPSKMGNCLSKILVKGEQMQVQKRDFGISGKSLSDCQNKCYLCLKYHLDICMKCKMRQ